MRAGEEGQGVGHVAAEADSAGDAELLRQFLQRRQQRTVSKHVEAPVIAVDARQCAQHQRIILLFDEAADGEEPARFEGMRRGAGGEHRVGDVGVVDHPHLAREFGEAAREFVASGAGDA